MSARLNRGDSSGSYSASYATSEELRFQHKKADVVILTWLIGDLAWGSLFRHGPVPIDGMPQVPLKVCVPMHRSV